MVLLLQLIQQRALSAWQLFSSGPFRKITQDENPGLGCKAIMLILSEQYQQLSEDQWKNLNGLVEKDKKRFEREWAEYTARGGTGFLDEEEETEASV